MDLLLELDKNYQTRNWNVNVERRFGCVVCLSAKFKMVYGLCQHRICTTCGYESNGTLKMAFRRCPTCQEENVFPSIQPNIPEDNIISQKLCGVRVCRFEGCGQEVWVWEKEDHELFCSHRNTSPKYPGRFTVKDAYSPITPKSPSQRRGKRRYVSDSEARVYSLRSSSHHSKRKSSLTPKAEQETAGYNLRHQRHFEGGSRTR